LINLLTLDLPDDRLISDLFMDGVGRGTVTAADEAGLFTLLAESGASSAAAVASKLGKDPRAIEAVFRVLKAMGFLTFAGGAYALTPVTRAYFESKSTCYRGYQFYSGRVGWEHQRVAKMIESGWNPIGQDNKSFTEMWEEGTLTQEAAHRFTGMMHTNISGTATAIARSGLFAACRHVIDAGGGSGVFLAALKQKQPDTICSLMDLPQVCEAARQILKNYVPIESLRFIPCNFFKDPWPTDADAIFFSNILHDWSYEKGLEILRHTFAALPSGGAVYVNECLLEESRLAPKHTVIFDLLMYMNHRAQQYTERELFAALRETGFVEPKRVFEFGYYSVVKAVKA
jgi:hypothetical protein